MPLDDAASNEGDWRPRKERVAIARNRSHILLRKHEPVPFEDKRAGNSTLENNLKPFGHTEKA